MRAVLPPTALTGAALGLANANKRTLAVKGIGLGHALKTVMTARATVPDDLELVDADPINTSVESVMRRSRSGSNAVDDSDDELS